MKTVDTLVEDIYRLMETKEIPEGVDAEKAIDDFGEAVKDMMRKQFSEYKQDRRTLRLSNVGRDARYLWNLVQGKEQEKILPHTMVKFLYGHLIEEMLLALVKLSGHTVSHEQEQCEVAGIKGSMDCKIDGVMTDVKSASTFGFKKFKEGTLAKDDPFGYIAQIKAYSRAQGDTEYGWLAMDKQNGHLTYLKYDEKDTSHEMHKYLDWDIEEHIENIKNVVKQETPPDYCAEPQPDGKSGNTKLGVKCSYCPFKKECYPNLRTFAYSTGPRFLVNVAKEPNVPEIGSNGDF